MSHTATVRRVYELLNADDVDGFGALLSDDFVEHEELPGLEGGRDGVIAFFRSMRAAFPDFRMAVEDLIDGGDKVVARVRLTGTHRGEFMGLAATGRAIDVPLIDIMRFGDDGLAREHWGVIDSAAMMEQLGAGGA